jgi:hypothetical protein
MRLLVASTEVHTKSGSHAIELMTWEVFAQEVEEPLPRIDAASARQELDAVIAMMNARFGSEARFPW